MELPIVVSVDEFNVGGFVDQIDLSVDVGPQGRRGSITFAGTDTPPVTPDASVTDFYGMVDIFEPGDLYIQTGSGTPYYAYLYIYQQQPGGNVWTPICPMQPNLYMGLQTFAFTAGVSSEEPILLNNILGTTITAIPASDFIVTATAVVSDTNSYALSVKTVTVDNDNNVLKIVLNGRTLAATTLANTSGDLPVNLSIGIKSD